MKLQDPGSGGQGADMMRRLGISNTRESYLDAVGQGGSAPERRGAPCMI
jgi:hypothetical protein